MRASKAKVRLHGVRAAVTPWGQARGGLGAIWARLSLATLLLGASAAGCESMGDGAGGGTSTGEAGGSLPDPCDPTRSPFVQAECLDALADRCHALDSEVACASAEPFVFQGYTEACAWAKIVRFTDPDTCAGAEVSGRCEARDTTWAPCGSYCFEGEDGTFSDLRAERGGDELLFLCGGPLSSDDALDAQGSPTFESCDLAEDVRPALCTCAPQACEAAP